MEARIRAMMTAWEDFGCSSGLEADLDDSLTCLSLFMSVSWKEFGRSSGAKADFDDSFTFLSRFIGGSDPCYDDILGRFWMLLRHGS